MNNSILIIDDEAGDIHLLSDMLLSEGFQVFAALSGRQGFERALQRRPSVILLDLHMPGMDGLATAQLIKADPRLASIPLLFLTGSATLDHKLQAFSLGAADYITKPFSAQEVIARVRVHMRQTTGSAPDGASAEPATALAPPPVSLTAGQRLVHAAQTLLHQQLDQPFNLAALARAVGTNERSLTQECRRYTGLSAGEFLQRLRQHKACELLLHTDLAIAVVAKQVGFTSAAAFTFSFRRYCGQTPTEYRATAGVGVHGGGGVMGLATQTTLTPALSRKRKREQILSWPLPQAGSGFSLPLLRVLLYALKVQLLDPLHQLWVAGGKAWVPSAPATQGGDGAVLGHGL